MKKYSTAILILVILGGLFWYLYDESNTGLKKARSSFASIQSQVDNLKSQRETFSNQIIALNQSVRDSNEFLRSWRKHYEETKDIYEAVINQVAEEAGCPIVDRKWDSDKVTVGKVEYEVSVFKGMVVGDYRQIVKFIGDLEAKLQFSTIWNLEFKAGLSGVTCSIEVYLPKFSFEGMPL